SGKKNRRRSLETRHRWGLLFAHAYRDYRASFFSDNQILCHDAQSFLPDLERVLSCRHIFQRELALFVGYGIERVLGNHHPAAHPGMEITIHSEDLRSFEGERNTPRMRLCAIEWRIFLFEAAAVGEKTV